MFNVVSNLLTGTSQCHELKIKYRLPNEVLVPVTMTLWLCPDTNGKPAFIDHFVVPEQQ